MKRAALIRRTPLRANAKRKAERMKRTFGDKAHWIRLQPCVLFRSVTKLKHGCEGHSEAAHVKSRGAGGDSESLIPLCTLHHAQQHTLGRETFAKRYKLNMGSLAKQYHDEWLSVI